MTKHEQILEARDHLNLLEKHFEILEEMMEDEYHRIDRLTEQIEREKMIHNEGNRNGILL